MKILFVCMGNICRSPAAEGVMRAKLQEASLGKKVDVDSAGTIDFHIGKLPDSRMRRAASARGIELTHHARQVSAADLEEFDHVLVMDRENFSSVKSLDHDGKFTAKIKLFCEFCTKHIETEVPDPYLGTARDFENVLDILDDGCAEIVRRIQTGTLV